jgi:hypothetical protein
VRAQADATGDLVEVAAFVDEGMFAEGVFRQASSELHAYGQYIVVPDKFLRESVPIATT